jgi:hypothetical protein
MNKGFRSKRDGPRLTPDEAERQGRATRCAWEAFAEPGAAIAFLNGFDETLGGRPIDLAIASADGLAAVEQAIAEKKG